MKSFLDEYIAECRGNVIGEFSAAGLEIDEDEAEISSSATWSRITLEATELLRQEFSDTVKAMLRTARDTPLE